jgi:transposase-like protein
MPWNLRDTKNLRPEFIQLALQKGVNRCELCRRFGIRPKTAYRWLARHARHGDAALAHHSRRL